MKIVMSFAVTEFLELMILFSPTHMIGYLLEPQGTEKYTVHLSHSHPNYPQSATYIYILVHILTPQISTTDIYKYMRLVIGT